MDEAPKQLRMSDEGLSDEDRYPNLSDLLEDFLTPQIEMATDPMQPEQQMGLFVEKLQLDLPIELQTLRDEQGELLLGVSPPTQWIETSVEPVLHRVNVTLTLDEELSYEDTAQPEQ